MSRLPLYLRTICFLFGSTVLVACDGLQLGSNTLSSAGTCRDYVTSYTEDGLRWSCSYDAADNTHTCTSGTKVIKKKWGSFSAFLEETTMGVETFSLVVDENNSTLIENTFDDVGQITRRVSVALGIRATTYDSWDENGRPLTGTYDLPDNACKDVSVTISYDSSQRTVTGTEDFSNSTGTIPGSSIPCSTLPQATVVTTYNSQGVRTGVTKSNDSTYSYTLHSMGRICDN